MKHSVFTYLAGLVAHLGAVFLSGSWLETYSVLPGIAEFVAYSGLGFCLVLLFLLNTKNIAFISLISQ